MLERTSTCIESGGRKLFRTAPPCLRTRRKLHSTFWHHGASDLGLPLWWAASQLAGAGSNDQPTRPSPSSLYGTYSGDSFLDFLYPEKTLALLRQLSAAAPDAATARRRVFPGVPVRRYATAQRQSFNEEKTSRLGNGDPAVDELRQLMKDKTAAQSAAWRLYTTIPASALEGDVDGTLRADLLEYLTVKDDPAVPRNVLAVFEEMPEHLRRTSSYRAALAAHLSLRMIGQAFQLLESIPSDRGLDFTRIGVDLILRRTILDGQWDLSLRAFGLFLTQKKHFGQVPTPVAIRWGNALPDIWKGATSIHKFEKTFQKLINHVREFQNELRSSPDKEEMLSLFVISFVPHVISQILRDQRRTEKNMVQYIRHIFRELDALELPMAECYEHCIKQLLNVPDERAVTDIPLLISSFYNDLKQLCLDTTVKERAKPSLNLLRNLIVYYWDHGKIAQAIGVIQDHRTLLPNEPMRAGLLEYLIHRYGYHGDLKHTQEYLDEFKILYKKKLDLKLVTALPLACARRADVDGTITCFNRISQEYGFVPDLTCWNILLLSYIRAEDIDGALECFNTIIGNGLTPDVYTFGPLLDICARRGDVEAFEALYSRAEQLGVNLKLSSRARSAYVLAFLRAGDPEGAEAIAQKMLESWKAGKLDGYALTHTWNLLIQQHALEGDLAGAQQRYREMIDNSIPLDTWTYGSLMRALIEVKQTNAAYRILRTTMPQNGVRAHALHYAIVMTGFLREGGGQLDMAIAAYQMMKKQGLYPTPSSQEASIRTLASAELRKLAYERPKHPNYKLKDVEEAVEAMVADAIQGQLLFSEPQQTRHFKVHGHASVPQSFYGLLISLYAQRGAYKIWNKLLRKAENLTPNVDNYTVPMNLIIGEMQAHASAGEHEEVAKCWSLARTTADELSKTFAQAARPDSTTTRTSDDLLDPAILQQYENSATSVTRRIALIKATRVYIRSLIDPSNPDPHALKTAESTMRDLLVNGYAIDVFTWNELVRAFARRGRLLDAFAICEEYLMPSFPGWRHLAPNYIRRDRKGYQWYELRHDEVKKDRIMVRYKTLVVLAGEYGEVKRDEQNGIGYDETAGAWHREKIERNAPMTMRAIESMPNTNDMLQLKFLGA
ncbi:hypothetical protein IQ06DRAFT_245645 [Phaeosphaeriaceae sp. SRC1lsM3a]|nr:hypothetical protein IQ06DRAFT_245645 [Stagonospora sp. SRC1lsM3a]